MICKSIEEYALRYLENESGTKERHKFEKHIDTCGRCRKMFHLIKANYHIEELVSGKEVKLSENIDALIDKNRYDINTNNRRISLKKIIFVSVAFALLIFTVTNADTIFKTFSELKNRMFIDEQLMNPFNTKYTGIYSDQEYVKSVYEKYGEVIQEKIDQMETGEKTTLAFDEDGMKFYVQISKGIEGNFIAYWFDGYRLFENDFSKDFSKRISEAESESTGQYDSIEELIYSAGFAPVPGYIPDGFNFTHARQVASGRGQTIPHSLMLFYGDSDGKTLSVYLTRGKMLAEAIGIPEEMQQAANLFLQQVDENTSGEETGPEQVMEELLIGGYQAIYTERPVYSIAMDGTYKIFKTVSVYLGDVAKLPILRIESSDVDKETLIEVASQVEIKNNDKNRVDDGNYFRGINDEKVLAYTGIFLEKLKAGELEIRLKVDDNTEFYRYKHNDTYYIRYWNVPPNQYQSMVPLAISLDDNFLNNFDHADIQILGWPYSDAKQYCLNFVRKNASIGIRTHRAVKLPDGIEITDYIINRMCLVEFEINHLYSNSGHLYYWYDISRFWIFETAFEENGIVRDYTITIDKKIMKDFSEVVDFINSLKPLDS